MGWKWQLCHPKTYHEKTNTKILDIPWFSTNLQNTVQDLHKTVQWSKNNCAKQYAWSTSHIWFHWHQFDANQTTSTKQSSTTLIWLRNDIHLQVATPLQKNLRHQRAGWSSDQRVKFVKRNPKTKHACCLTASMSAQHLRLLQEHEPFPSKIQEVRSPR